MSIERDAIQILAKHGWHQGDFRGPAGGFCAVGALLAAEDACTGDLIENGVWRRVSDVAFYQFPERCDSSHPYVVASFNDHPDTTIDDVILVLEKAALRAEEQA